MAEKQDGSGSEQVGQQAGEQGIVFTPPRGKFTKGRSGNPAGRPRKDAAPPKLPDTLGELDKMTEQQRMDAGWHSLLTGLGTLRDRRKWVKFTAEPIDWNTAFELWRGDPWAARCVEIPPNEMTREGYELCIVAPDGSSDDADDEAPNPVESVELSPRADRKHAIINRRDAVDLERFDSAAKDLAEEVEHEWEDIGLLAAIYEALCYERAYGGAAILIGTDDSDDLSKPLAIANVKSIKFVTALEPRELQAVAWYGNPRAPKFGEPALYQLTTTTNGPSIDGAAAPLTARIHESRLVVFPGIRVTKRQMSNMGGWGDNIFTRINSMLRDYNISWSSAAILMSDFAQAVYKMEGLNELLVEDAKGIFKKRADGMNLARDTMNAIMIDGKDSFERQQTPVTGLPDLLDKFATAFSAIVDIPLPLFFGVSPGGINASGASGDQLRMWYDKVKSQSMRKVVPALRKVTEIQFAIRGLSPDKWSIKPRPLWQLSETEQANNHKTQMETDTGYIDRGVLSETEVREARFGGDDYSYHTPIKKTAGATPGDAEAKYRAEMAAGGDGVTDPNAPAPTPGGAPSSSNGGATNVAATAMNGAQITSLIEVVTSVNTKAISRESGLAILTLAFKVDPTEAQALLGPETFEPVKPPTPPSPFGGGGPTPPAPAKPDAPPEQPKPPAPPAPKAPEGDA